MLMDDLVRGGVKAGVGDLIKPMPELIMEIVEVAEAAAEKEVLANVAERTLALAFGFGQVSLAGFGKVAVMAANSIRLRL